MDDHPSSAMQIITEIFSYPENFKESIDINRVIENKLNSYHTDEGKLKFLNTLENEGQIQFGKFNDPTKKVTNLPQYTPYYNIQMQIKSLRNDICIKKNLSFLMIENERFDGYLLWFEKKLKVTSAFIERENFINSEIKRISDEFINPIDIKFDPGWKVTSSMNYSEYKKYGYQWLMSGNDISIEQIVLRAKQNYTSSGGKIPDEIEFNNAIIDNLRDGVAFVQYEKFLYAELKNVNVNKQLSISATNLHIGDNFGHLTQTGHKFSSHRKNKFQEIQKPISEKGWLLNFFSNQWIITIIGGLVIAFLAKIFGWI